MTVKTMNNTYESSRKSDCKQSSAERFKQIKAQLKQTNRMSMGGGKGGVKTLSSFNILHSTLKFQRPTSNSTLFFMNTKN